MLPTFWPLLEFFIEVNLLPHQSYTLLEPSLILTMQLEWICCLIHYYTLQTFLVNQTISKIQKAQLHQIRDFVYDHLLLSKFRFVQGNDFTFFQFSCIECKQFDQCFLFSLRFASMGLCTVIQGYLIFYTGNFYNLLYT